jgi:short-subunit dehydrogenase
MRVLIVGATSGIAQVVVRLYARDGARLLLVGRDAAKLQAVAADAHVRGAAAVETLLWDARQWERAGEVVRRAREWLQELDVVLIAHGSLPQQAELWHNPVRAIEEFHITGTSVIALLAELVPVLEVQRHGVVGVISSVAGERGRAAMAIYGAAKAAVTAATAGVRGHLAQYGVRVITIKPGFVDTPMIAHLPRSGLIGAMIASPERVGRRIYRALQRGRPDNLYVPWWWRWVMLLVRAIPEPLFKRLRM